MRNSHSGSSKNSKSFFERGRNIIEKNAQFRDAYSVSSETSASNKEKSGTTKNKQ